MCAESRDSHHASYIAGEEVDSGSTREHGKVLDLKTEGDSLGRPQGFPVAGIDALTVFPDRVEAAYDGKSVDLQQQVCLEGMLPPHSPPVRGMQTHSAT
jgi:hypothetical protein